MASVEVEQGPITLADVATSFGAGGALMAMGYGFLQLAVWFHETDVTSLFLSLFS